MDLVYYEYEYNFPVTYDFADLTSRLLQYGRMQTARLILGTYAL